MGTYKPKEEHGNAPTEEWAQLVLAVAGVSGILGASTLNCSIARLIVASDVDTRDAKKVIHTILELCRMQVPVNNINTIILEEKILIVNRKTVTLPKDSVVVSLIGATSLENYKDLVWTTIIALTFFLWYQKSQKLKNDVNYRCQTT